MNTTVGIFGIGDPAQKLGLKDTKEDLVRHLVFMVLAKGCYFVLPVLGPTTARDSVGMIGDTFIDPFAHYNLETKRSLK